MFPDMCPTLLGPLDSLECTCHSRKPSLVEVPAAVKAVIIGYIVFAHLEVVFLVVVKENVVIIIDNECHGTYRASEQVLYTAKIMLCTDTRLLQMGEDPNQALRKFPYEDLGAKNKLGYEIQNTFIAVPGARISGTRYVCSFF